MKKTASVLKTAVVGLGRIAWSFHVPQVVKQAGFELAAVVDPLPERLREAQERFKPGACFASTDELYAAMRPDLVIVASPTLFHKRQVLEAFERGCDVFCDKPIALNLAEADEMFAAMQATGRKLMVYQPHRVTPEVCALKSILDSGRLGRLYLVRHSVAGFSRRADWQAFRKNGGGMLNNYGAHYIDQFLFLNRSPFRKFRCELRAVVTLGDAEDVVKAVISAENGVTLDLDINMAAAAPMSPWYVAGDRGAAVLDAGTRTWTVTYVDPGELEDVKLQVGMAAANRSYGNGETIPWRTETVRTEDFPGVDFFAKCREYFIEGAAPFVPVSETREVMRALAECRRDAGWDA